MFVIVLMIVMIVFCGLIEMFVLVKFFGMILSCGKLLKIICVVMWLSVFNGCIEFLVMLIFFIY